jgi:AcrR family transcriptional regulator
VIAREARITKAAIYHHFKNKKEILYSVMLGSIDRLVSNLREISGRKDDPIKELTDMINVQASYNSQKINAKVVFENSHFLGKKYEGIIKSRQREIIEIYKKKLEEIAAMGRLKDINIATARFSLLGMVNWLYQWYNPDGKLSIEEIKKDIVKIIFYGMIREDPGDRLERRGSGEK